MAALFGLLCWLTDCLVASCSALLVFVVWCLLFPGYFLFVDYCVLVSWVVVILFVCLRFLVCFTYGFAGAFVVVVSCGLLVWLRLRSGLLIVLLYYVDLRWGGLWLC